MRLSLVAVLLAALALVLALFGGGNRARGPTAAKAAAPSPGIEIGPEYPVAAPVFVSRAAWQTKPKMAFDGTNYLVVWHEDRGFQFGDVYAARVAPDGTDLDPYGIPVAVTSASETSPSVAFDGTNFLVTWTRSDVYPQGDVYGARISPAGAVVDVGGFPITTAPNLQDYSAVAFDGTNYLVSWMSGSVPTHIYAARVAPSGAVLDPDAIAVSTASGSQGLPDVAFDGENYLVVWEDQRNGAADVYGARVTPAGTVLDPSGFAVSSATDVQWAPRLAFDGTNFLVVWEDGRNSEIWDVYGARVAPDGTVLDSSGIPISTATDFQLTPSVVFGDTSFTVVWTDDRSGERAYGARVSSAGVVMDPNGIPISTSGGGFPGIGFDGTNYLVGWQRSEPGTGKQDLYAARVDTSGGVLDPDGRAIDRLAPSDQYVDALGFDGTNYLAVWQDYRAGNSDIYAGRVTEGGGRLDGTGIPVATGPDDEVDASVTFDGADYLVAWEVDRPGPHQDVFGARISPSGTLLDPGGIAISSLGSNEAHPAAASDGSSSLVVWADSRNAAKDRLPYCAKCGPPPPPPPPPPPEWDIYGARVDGSGAVLDSGGIAISTRSPDQLDPAVAFDGTNYLAVWADGPYAQDDIYGSRVSPGGSVLDPGGIVIATGFDDQDAPAVGSADHQSFVAWEDTQAPDYDIDGARVDANGTVLDPNSIQVSGAPGNQMSPAVAFDGLDYLAVWADNRDGDDLNPAFKLYGSRVDTTGSVLDPNGMHVSDWPWSGPAVVRGSSGAGLAYGRLGTEPPYGGALRAFFRFASDPGAPPPPPPPPPPAPPPPPPPPASPPPPPPPPPPTRPRCVVPRVVGRTLASARRRIRRAHCRVGRVRRVHSRAGAGRVVAQSPHAGARRLAGSRVNLTVSRGR